MDDMPFHAWRWAALSVFASWLATQTPGWNSAELADRADSAELSWGGTATSHVTALSKKPLPFPKKREKEKKEDQRAEKKKVIGRIGSIGKIRVCHDQSLWGPPSRAGFGSVQ